MIFKAFKLSLLTDHIFSYDLNPSPSMKSIRIVAAWQQMVS